MRFNLKKDVEDGLKYCPSLRLSFVNKRPVVQGTFTAHNATVQIEDYDVVIEFPDNYPFDLPLVIETSKKIPRSVSRHVFADNRLCFGNLQDVWRVCKNGISFKWFLREILNPHLCREYVREETGVYPTGERSHANNGIEGIWEGYYDIFKTVDKVWILRELNQMFTNNLYSRNKSCYCNSGRKYKRCHLIKEQMVFDVGRHKALKLYQMLKDHLHKS